MKVALLHSFMDNIGGAEMVTLSLARSLGADVYTTNVDGEKIRKMGFADVLPRVRSIGRVPIRAPFRHQLALWRFRRLDLRGAYDACVVSGDWAMSAAVRNRPCLWYVHSPLNELWAFKDYVRERILAPWQRPIFDAWVWANRKLSRRYARSVDRFVVNSENTRRRLARYYGAEGAVVNPPTYTDWFRYEPPRGYWLSVNRLLAHKRVELQLAAFAAMPDRKLIVVGSYEQGAAQFESYRARMEALRPANVEFRSWVSREELVQLYAGCEGFVTTARDEDFGLTAVEAMAAGKPVVAPAEGGYLESVVDGETGVLVRDADAEKISAAVARVSARLAENPLAYRDACQARARKFGANRFAEAIRRELERLVGAQTK